MCDLINVVNSVLYWLVRLLFTKPVSVCEPVQKYLLKHITPNTGLYQVVSAILSYILDFNR